MAIALGTANTRLYVLDRGLVAEEPTRASAGGACLRGIDRLIARQTSIEVKIIADPTRATIAGAGEILTVARQAELWETGWSSSPGFGE